MTVGSSIKNFVRLCDIFGQSIQMNLQNQNKFQTFVGGFVSLITITIFVIIFQRAALSLYDRTEYNVIERTFENRDPSAIDFESTFMFGVRIVTKDRDPFISNITLSLMKHLELQNGTILKTSISLTQCNANHFSQIPEYKFDQLFLDLQTADVYFCPVLDELKAQESQIKSINLNLKLSSCNESNCDVTSILQEMAMVSTEFLMVEFLFTDFRNDNYETTKVTPYLNRKLHVPFIPGSQTPIQDLQIMKNILYDGKSILPGVGTSSQEFSTIYPESWATKNIFMNNPNNLAEFKIGAYNLLRQINIKYQTLDTFLAYLGGILKILFTVIGLVLTEYNRFSLYVQLANSLYSFNLPVSKNYLRRDSRFSEKKIHYFSNDILKQKLSQRVIKVKKYTETFRQKVRKVINLNKYLPNGKYGSKQKQSLPQLLQIQQQQQKSPSHLDNSDKIIVNDNVDRNVDESNEFTDRYSFLNAMFNDILHCETQIEMTFKYMLTIITCRKLFFKHNVQIQLIDKAVRMIQTDMDIMVIMDRLSEIDKLKKLILTDNQIMLFNYMPKTIITVEKELNDDVITFKTQRSSLEVNDRIQNKKKQQQRNSTQQMFDKKLKFDSKEGFYQLYEAFAKITSENIQATEQQTKVNKFNEKLKNLMGQQIIQIFEASFLLYDPKEKYIDNFEQYLKDPHYQQRKIKKIIPFTPRPVVQQMDDEEEPSKDDQFNNEIPNKNIFIVKKASLCQQNQNSIRQDSVEEIIVQPEIVSPLEQIYSINNEEILEQRITDRLQTYTSRNPFLQKQTQEQ